MYNLNTRIIDLTVADLIEILEKHKGAVNQPPKDYTQKRYVYGLAGLAKLFNCCTGTAHVIKKSGKIDAAISQEGRKIVVDAELALELLKKG